MPGIGHGIGIPFAHKGFQWSTYWTTQGTAELIAYTAGLTTDLSTAQKLRLTTFVKALKTGLSITDLNDVFDAMYILAGETAESSLRNLVRNAYHATMVNSPSFTAFEGFTGNGVTSYIRSNYNPSVNGVNFVLNNAAIGVYSRTNSDSNGVAIGARDGVPNDILLLQRFGNKFYGRINNGEGKGVVNNNTDSSGLFMVTRYGSLSTNIVGYRNKTTLNAVGVGNPVSTDIPNAEIYIGALNVNGIVNNISIRQHSLAFFSKHITSAMRDVIVDSFEAYMDANGKGVIA